MLFREFLGASKSITNRGVWSDKKMPKTGGQFPLSKNHSYRLGGAWRWRVVELVANATTIRLLIAYQSSKQQYVAALGIAQRSDTLVLAKVEFHATHAGWHVHCHCGQQDANHWGRMKYPDMIRIPGGMRRHRRTAYSVDDDSAIIIAARYFRIPDLTPDAPNPGNFSLFPEEP